MRTKALGLAVLAAAAMPAALAAPAAAQTVDTSNLPARSVTMGGASPLPTDRTVAHWSGSALDPHNAVTYGYNMVGADPFTCKGTACDTTVTTDITPINVTLDGYTFTGSDVVTPTLNSPVFAANDYTRTSHATAANGAAGPGGTLSAGNSGVQLEDATMRSQFNRTGSSPYHVRLAAAVHPAITINVPQNQGTVLLTGGGPVADIDVGWWSSQIGQLDNLGYVDATHLPLWLTSNVVLYDGNDPGNCCIIGYHGAAHPTGSGAGSTNSNGNSAVQTFAWSSYVTPGIFRDWALQDIHAVSHEIAEWADDPFTNNWVEPWLTPTAPQYGCTNILETGDPVVGIGFSMGKNAYGQRLAGADGTYHPEDEVFLPWFMRTSPNTVSQPTQSGSGGRYTLMGDLNPFPGFRAPATGC